MKKFLLVIAVIATAITTIFGENSKIKSYDTIYYEDSTKYRQIYINDDVCETYILVRNDSIVLFKKNCETNENNYVDCKRQ